MTTIAILPESTKENKLTWRAVAGEKESTGNTATHLKGSSIFHLKSSTLFRFHVLALMEKQTSLACRSCNLHKSDHVTGIDETGKPAVRLFHPRQDDWEEHFKVDTETGRVE